MCQKFCLFLDEDSTRRIEKDLRARVPCRLHCAVLVARPINLGFARERESGSWMNEELSTTPRAVLLRTIRGFRIFSDRWDKNHEGSLRIVTTILDSTITKNWTQFENIKLGQDCQLIVRLVKFVSRMFAESKLTSGKLRGDCSLRMLRDRNGSKLLPRLVRMMLINSKFRDCAWLDRASSKAENGSFENMHPDWFSPNARKWSRKWKRVALTAFPCVIR